MKSYPSIPTDYSADEHFYCFDKLDGSNIRAEWDSKKGFQRFGTRKLQIDAESPFFLAARLIRDRFEDQLTDSFKQAGYKSATCFFEYFGPNSFAGTHRDPMDQMDAVLLDVNIYRFGLLPPERFLTEFGHLNTPTFFGVRKLDREFVGDVKSGELDGMTFEGVIGKRYSKNKVWMVKIKNRKWIEKLRLECTNEEEFKRRL